MKHFTTALLLAFATTAHAQTTYELTNVGTTFDPPVINMVVGDSIHLVLPQPHTCTQVDEGTWMDNENTPNGGFNFPSGEHTFVLDVPGTYFYVCTPHANMGMKGQFIVSIDMAVPERSTETLPHLYPDPASQQVTFAGVKAGSSISVYAITGQMAMQTTASANSTMDVSGLDVGTYVVSVKNEQGMAILQKRFVVSR